MKTQDYRRTAASVIILMLFVFLLYLLMPILGGIVASILMFVLFEPIHISLKKKKVNSNVAALLIVFVTLMLIVIPLLFGMGYVIGHSSNIISFISSIDLSSSGSFLTGFNDVLGPGINLQSILNQIGTSSIQFLEWLITSAINSFSNLMISIVIMYFMLYFLLTETESFSRVFYELIPFTKDHTQQLMKEFKRFTYSTILSLVVLGVVQGITMLVGLLLFGVNNAIILSLLTAVASVVPIFGTGLVWISTSIILILQGNTFRGIGVLLWGAIAVANIDNIIRPMISKKYANIHPLVTLIGVLIGLPHFGMMGLLIGPLLITYFFLMLKMFKQEYID